MDSGCANPYDGNAVYAGGFCSIYSINKEGALLWQHDREHRLSDQAMSLSGEYIAAIYADGVLNFYANTFAAPSNITAPLASFTSNRTSGSIPLVIQFTDNSTGSPETWNWSFGDGTYSTAKNPVYTYRNPGSYTVALNITNPGGFNQSVRTGFITAWIKADFNGNGRVDISDVTKVAYMTVDMTPLDLSADFDMSGDVEVGDAARIAWYYVGKIPEL